MTSGCHPPQMPWSGATGAIARCKRVSTGCGRKSRSVRVLRWICGVKLKPKAVNKPLPYFIVHELDKPGSSATVSLFEIADQRQHGEHGLHQHTILPLAARTQLEVDRIACRGMEGGITQDN